MTRVSEERLISLGYWEGSPRATSWNLSRRRRRRKRREDTQRTQCIPARDNKQHLQGPEVGQSKWERETECSGEGSGWLPLQAQDSLQSALC